MKIMEALKVMDQPRVRLYIALFLSIALIMGLLFSKAIMSIATILFAVNAILSKHVVKYYQILIKDVGLIALIVIFLIFALSGINSTNWTDYSFAVRTKLPLLLMPLCLLPLRQINTRQYYFILTIFTYITTIVSIAVLIYANIYFDSNALGRGGIFQTPVNHVRYSLIVAFSIVTGIYSLYKKFRFLGNIEIVFRLVSVLFLAYFIHILAVRSGLMALYLFALYAALYYLLNKKKGIKALFILVGAFFLLYMALKYVPSLKVKEEYMRYEWNTYNQGRANREYGSDMGRWRSYIVAIDIYKRHPLWGVGIGDIDDSTKACYKKLFPNAPVEQFFSAHNQYLFTFSALGGMGGVSFIVCLLIPAFYKSSYRHFLFMGFQRIIWMSFIFEAPLQEQAGLTFYWFFTLFLYNYIHRHNDR